jgi:hypothetical protein
MKEYFNVAKSQSPNLDFLGIPILIALIVGICIFIVAVINKFKNRGQKNPLFIFSLIWISIVSFFSAMWLLPSSCTNSKLLTLYKSNNYSVVEGYVTDFDPMPFEGHRVESFNINGIHFEYSDFIITGGFNKTRSHGGPLSEGKYVKVYYVQIYSNDNIIIGLWVKE